MAKDRVKTLRSLVGDPPDHADPAAIRGLLNCLSPDEVCHVFDCKLNQPYYTRRLVLRRIGKDLECGLRSCHAELAKALLTRFNDLPYAKKQGCAATLDFLYDALPLDMQRSNLDLFFSSNYKAMRRRAYKRLRRKPDSPLHDSVWRAWERHRDVDTARLVIELAPASQLAPHFEEIEELVRGTWLHNRLYVRMAEIDAGFLGKLQCRDGIAFAYACVKTHYEIDEQTARDLYEVWKDDERIGLLIWCFGQLKLWHVLMDIATNPRHEPYAMIASTDR